MFLWVRQGRIVFKAADNIKDGILTEHQLKQGILVQQEDIFEDLIKMMQALRVLQVLTHVKNIQQFLNVSLSLDSNGQLLSEKSDNFTHCEFK